MIPVLGCEIAREMLEPFVDDELATADQVAVQAHLRSCGICTARVEDFILIGWSVRTGTPATTPRPDDSKVLAVIQSGVLTRLGAERAQSLRARVAEMFGDMRLFWPAAGATFAVMACLCGVTVVWHQAMQKGPNSLAARLEAHGNLGSDSNPLQLDSVMVDRRTFPRVMDEGLAIGQIADEADALLAVVVATSGRITRAELLSSAPQSGAPARPDGAQAVLNAVKEQRFTPGQALGRPVAVRTMWYITQTTAVLQPAARIDVPSPSRRREERPLPAVVPPAGQSGALEPGERGSATA
jgi:hypothetical protein